MKRQSKLSVSSYDQSSGKPAARQKTGICACRGHAWQVLPCGRVTKVDAEDYDLLANYDWHAATLVGNGVPSILVVRWNEHGQLVLLAEEVMDRHKPGWRSRAH